MKSILAALAVTGLAVAPAAAMCGHDSVAMSVPETVVADASTATDIDMEATASIPEGEEKLLILKEGEAETGE